MTDFDTMIQGAGWDLLSEVHGTTAKSIVASWTPAGAGAQTVDGLWSPGEIVPGYVMTGEDEIERGVLTMNPADLTGLPAVHDTVTIDGVVWAVVAIGRVSPLSEVQLERKTIVATEAGPRRA